VAKDDVIMPQSAGIADICNKPLHECAIDPVVAHPLKVAKDRPLFE